MGQFSGGQYEIDKQETLEFLVDYLDFEGESDTVFVATQLKVDIDTDYEELKRILYERIRTVKTSKKFGI